MNGQQRSSEFKTKDYSKLNLVKQIIELKDYRDYNHILFISPVPGTYLGYLGNDFFGFMVPEGAGREFLFMSAKEAIDYYLNHFSLIFRNTYLEYMSFNGKPEFMPYLSALKFKLENGDKKKK